MSALILALIAGISLAVVPHKITNEYADNGVTHAATEVINGVTYEVIYLDGDNAANKAKINRSGVGNYYYVLMVDWDLRSNTANIGLYGDRVIFDLHGHLVTTRLHSADGYCQLVFVSAVAEITDSSAAKTGTIDPCGGNSFSTMGKCREVIISGGNFPEANIGTYFEPAITILDGNLTRESGAMFTQSPGVITIAPYLKTTYNANGDLTAVQPYDAYAVSTTSYAPGVFNYAYGYRWEIDVIELRGLAVPTDRTYYLWGRDGNGTYEYLNCVYRDGAWQNVA